MFRSSLRCILFFGPLILGLDTVYGRQDPQPECQVKAWVRAPDLAPNTIVQGDGRVKITAECPTVKSISLGLRFKERSFLKALRSREDVTKLHPEPTNTGSISQVWNASAWPPASSRFANDSIQKAYEDVVSNKDLWIVREEERNVFQTTYPFDIGNGKHGTLRDAVQEFAILVPSTNFPPALDAFRTGFGLPAANEEIMNVEWIYEYFTQILFDDGTSRDVSAGFTAFQPLDDPARMDQPHGLASATTHLKPYTVTDNFIDDLRIANYSIQITSESGLVFSSGKKSDVMTVVVTRTGSARTFSEPLEVLFCIRSSLSAKWTAEYNMPNVKERHSMPTSVLRAASYEANQNLVRGSRFCFPYGDPQASVVMPNATSDELHTQKVVTVTSAPVTLSIDVDHAHITDFETYYQTLSNSLVTYLGIPPGEGGLNPDDPFSTPEPEGWLGPEFEDDEEAWVPWRKQPRPPPKAWKTYYWGRVPVVVRPKDGVSPGSSGCAGMNKDGTSDQAVFSSGSGGCDRHWLDHHYLDKGARGPVFLDRGAVAELLEEDFAERNRRAPVLDPIDFSAPEGRELVYRYYHHWSAIKQQIYVGETWAKKVVGRSKLTPSKLGHS